MFTVIQERDFTGRDLDASLVRIVYAVDRATESFLVLGSFGDFIWIPIAACRPVS